MKKRKRCVKGVSEETLTIGPTNVPIAELNAVLILRRSAFCVYISLRWSVTALLSDRYAG